MIAISVIIPVYNVENYLDVCIQSVLRQTFNNIEIILVDDGSTDNSSRICDTYAEKDQRIIVIHQINKGLGGARNTGISIARGEYILFLDSDDFICNNCCEDLYKTATEKQTDIVLSGETLFFDDSKTFKPGFRNYSEMAGTIQFISSKNYIDCFTPAWGRLYKRSFINKNKLLFIEKCCYEDNSWGCLVSGLTDKIAFAGNLFYYRQRNGSITSFKEYNALDFVNDYIYFEKQIKNIKLPKNKLKWAYQWYILNFYNYFYSLSDYNRHLFFNYIVDNFKINMSKEDFYYDCIFKGNNSEIYNFYKCIKSAIFPHSYMKIKLFGIIPLRYEKIEKEI